MLHDLRMALRPLLRKPGLTLAMIATLALGIGATSAVFSLINAVLLDPLPYPNADRLVRIWGRFTNPDIPRLLASDKEVLDYQKNFGSFEAVAAYVWRDANLTSGDEPERARVYYATHQLWQVLGVQPLLGRTFGPEDDAPGGAPVAVLSHGLWRRRFAGDPGIIGQTVHVNLAPRTVIGVMPPGFDFPGKADLWAPFSMDPARLPPRQQHYLEVVALLRPGITMEQATVDLRTQTSRWPEYHEGVYPPDSGWDTYLVSLLDQEVGDVRAALFTLLGAVAFVLLITCANVGSMLLVRIESRSREILVRAALGARRGALIRQFALESLLLALVGGLLGLLAASWVIRAIVLRYPDAIPRSGGVDLDVRVVAFTLAVALLTGLLVSLLPAWQAARPHLSLALKEAGASTTGSAGRLRSQRALVVVEIALAIALLVGAGLMIRSFFQLRQEGVGFAPERVVAAQLALPRVRYPEGPQISGFFAELERRLAAEPGVEAVGMVTHLPLGGTNFTATLGAEGRPVVPGTPQPEPGVRTVTPGYFATLGIPLRKGRAFTAGDGAEAPLVAILDERLAENLWPGQEPLGRRVRLGPPDAPEEMVPWRTVVGIAGKVRDEGPAVPPSSEGLVYFPMAQEPERAVYLSVRAASADTASVVAAVRRHLRELDRDQPIADVQTMEERLGRVLSRQRFAAVLLAGFGVLALVLAAIGIYALIAQTVARSTREIGIRMALGADRGDILGMMAKRGLALVAVGVVLGLGLSLALGRLIARLLYGVEASDPATFGGVAVLLSAVALVAVLWPARRASRLHPMTAFRQE